jgi:ferredoxin
MRLPQDRSLAHRHIAILYHSAAGGTRLVAELLGELLSMDHDVRATGIYEAGAVGAAEGADFIVLCYPTYFLRPSRSMKEFIDRLAPTGRPRAAYLVTTYELYTENSLRACSLLLRDKGVIVTGSAAIRAPGSDLTCVVPDWLCPWLYRFGRGLPERLRFIANEVRTLARLGVSERLPWPKWYTPVAQALQRGFLDGFFEWRNRIRILPDRCSDCGACISGCFRNAWVREGLQIRHDPERCELCTRCIHRCPRNAIVLSYHLKDNKRLDGRRYAQLKADARMALLPPGTREGKVV